MSRPSREARIDLAALASNVTSLRALVSPVQTMIVVKANGYGHGAVPVAAAARDAGTEWLGVASVAEALALRDAGITGGILAWLHGSDADFDTAVAAGVDLGLSTRDQLERAGAASGRAFVHLKIDTGLSRNGFEQRDYESVLHRAAELERAGALVVRGIFSHLANAGEVEDNAQLERFESALAAAEDAGLRPELRHLASTAAAIRRPETRFDLVRLGIGAYGLSPFEDATSAELGLRPVMELSAEIASVKRVPGGSGVSYGYTHRTEKESTVALIPLGYADGIPRAASSLGPVSINGTTYRVSGRVAMDQFVVDLGDDRAAEGDRAVLFGDPTTGVPSADDWAEASGTINYEIVTRLGARVSHTYLP